VVLGEEGRRFFWDVALHPQRADLAAELLEFLALAAAERPGAAGLTLGIPHPLAQRGFREVEFPRHRRDCLPGLPDQSDRVRLERFAEVPPLPSIAHDHSCNEDLLAK
jgi:hypothetical protein